ncbi:hypothetical protein [Rhodopseudomonas sp. RCAM05734]|uniref:hypothetical protein n=1 Tax=Rhodopseudomonas sp. RCAM05734 TaxID=3457549 RepID=UPI004043E83E
MARGKLDIAEVTPEQEAFWVGLTSQRVANLWAAADDWADLSPEAKDFLRKADKAKIKQLDATISFMNAAGIIGKFLWIGAATLFGLFIGVSQPWKAFGEFFTVKIK